MADQKEIQAADKELQVAKAAVKTADAKKKAKIDPKKAQEYIRAKTDEENKRKAQGNFEKQLAQSNPGSVEIKESFFRYLDKYEEELNEDGEMSSSMGVPDVTGSAINTTNIGGQFAAKLGEVPNYKNPGKYKANPNTLLKRRVESPSNKNEGGNKKKFKFNPVHPTKPPKSESVELDKYIDNIFE